MDRDAAYIADAVRALANETKQVHSTLRQILQQQQRQTELLEALLREAATPRDRRAHV